MASKARQQAHPAYWTELDVPYTVEDRPLWWHILGLQQTASGYGRALTSSRVIRLTNGQTRRIYVSQFGNAGTAWVNYGGTIRLVR